ncbi:UDP-N-acetylmuramoyl-L-alanine--D-glutamate ligase [Gemella haemolysans]|uniref:UDP-N-acetylmuramoyl-L-alanine--D-glutamate ligase n=1 Tax=Gemella haemolysans TaxID=1379 RepID=UPI00195B2283|nr:UDP-N-acetylmuramoyl-L-alanine--D-glutamate ligase [Gemella haemolysans]VTX57220.1 UDP-N-acetylmuramoylalanine--D-glutamate ligase [Gemella haemolysans]
MINLEDKKILVLGFARSGYSTAKILNKLGYDVTLNAYDDLSNDEKATELKKLGVKVIGGGHPLELLENIDLIVKNPGIKYEIDILQKAIEKNIDIITEIELANTLFNIDMVAITGTNGKTTTTQMTFDILKAANKDVYLAGNIGYPAIEVAYNHPNSLIITEVSSFQLQGTKYFKPSVATITNLGVGHLDYHGSVENYRNAKRNIYKNQTNDDILILNIKEKEKYDLETIHSNVLFYDTKENNEASIMVKNNIVTYDEVELFDITKLSLPGMHNVENAINAAVISYIKGARIEVIQEVLYEFSGVKHRLQYVGEHNGVKYYNDSKATNPVATTTALSGFEKNIILICGGKDRGIDFKELVPFFPRIKAMVVVGESKEILYSLAVNNKVNCHRAIKVDDATILANTLAVEGDTILLSPACASWDQYKCFEDRGDEFIATFKKIIQED